MVGCAAGRVLLRGARGDFGFIFLGESTKDADLFRDPPWISGSALNLLLRRAMTCCCRCQTVALWKSSVSSPISYFSMPMINKMLTARLIKPGSGSGLAAKQRALNKSKLQWGFVSKTDEAACSQPSWECSLHCARCCW